MYECHPCILVLLITLVFEIEYHLYDVELSIKENEIYKRLGNNMSLIFKKGDAKSYAMNEMRLATIFIMTVGLNVIWKTCDMFYVYK